MNNSDPNIQDANLFTPIMFAVKIGNLEIVNENNFQVKLLIKYECNFQKENKDQMTALDLAY